MRLNLILALLLFVLCPTVDAQSMIGLTKTEVEERVKKQHREFRKDITVVRQRFNYLKYVNGIRTKTWILYFTEDDICKSSKLVCDYSDFADVVEELSSSYEKVEDSHWEYVQGSDTLQVILSKQEWYFTVRESRKEPLELD